MTSMANQEWSLAQLIAKAEAYCATTEHCISEVKYKLIQWHATPEQIEQIIPHLQKEKFIDEQRYCAAFVHDKLLYQGWGRMKMRAQLQTKHLPSTAIEQALSEIDEQVYQSVLEKIITSKKRTISTSDPHAKDKLLRFCLQRGFTYDEIKDI